jgi:hypothetical protein
MTAPRNDSPLRVSPPPLSKTRPRPPGFSQYSQALFDEMMCIRLKKKDKQDAGRKVIMDKRKQVLVVTNAITEGEVQQIRDAFTSNRHAPQKNMKITLVHVIPYLPTCYFNIPSMGILVERYFDEATESLRQVGRQLSVTEKDQWLISGKVRTEVLRLATKLNSSFILAGAQQIQELQRSLFFKNIQQCAVIRNVNQLQQL